MTQTASMLAVATVFVSLWTVISRQRRGLIYKTKIPTQELELAKSAYNMRGGRNFGILQFVFFLR